jgi:hypothetical protein
MVLYDLNQELYAFFNCTTKGQLYMFLYCCCSSHVRPHALHILKCDTVVLCAVMVSVLAIGLEACGFQPGRGRWIFKDDKNPQHDFLWRSKPVCPCPKISRHFKDPFEV